MSRSTLDQKDRLSIFDKETRDVIEADMIKMRGSGKGRSYEDAEHALGRIEKEVSRMAAEKDETFARLYEQIQRQAASNNQQYNSHESLAKLMNIPDDMEYTQGEEEDEDDEAIVWEEKKSAELRQRHRPSAPPPPSSQQTFSRTQQRPIRAPEVHDNINIPYYVLRVLFMIFLIFIVPYIQSYFLQ